MFGLIGTLFFAGLAGFLAERLGLVRNGMLTSVLIACGGGALLYLLSGILGIHVGGRFATSVAGAAGALAIEDFQRR